MAKKKVKPKTVAEIPADELKRFGLGLVGLKRNVFMAAAINWGGQLEAGDDLFDRLKAEVGVEKCEHCDTWQASRDMDKSLQGHCTDCVDEINDEGDDEDE